MRRTTLNLSALRRGGLPKRERGGDLKDQLLASSDAVALSRRTMLGLAGVAAVDATPLLQSAAIGSFEIAGDERRLSFQLGGRDRWVIDTRQFAGTPRLSLKRTTRLIRLEISHARYPGTEIPADLVCEIRRGMVGWRMTLQMAFGNLRGEAPFERWLSGAAILRSQVILQQPVCSLDKAAAIVASGPAWVEFSPDWTLRVTGNGLARVRGLLADVQSDALTITLLQPTDPSIMNQPGRRRTLIALDRGRRDWSIPLVHNDFEAGDLISTPDAFDALRVEAGESQGGLIRTALAAECASSDAKVAFRPAGDLTGPSGEPFHIRLRGARYAVAFDPTGRQTALIARFADQSEWMHGAGCSVELGGASEGPGFELVTYRGRTERFQCAPAVRRLVTPLRGAVVEPSRTPEGARLVFVAGQVPVLRDKSIGQVRVDRKKGSAPVQITSWTASVLRPEDLLALDFSFINLNLETSGSQPRLVRAVQDKAAYVVVTFPPQHIAEQAYPEPPEALPPESTRPAMARISGPSRLAFLIPNDVQEIPYTLEALLDWSRYEQSVAANATPPPPPPIRVSRVPTAGSAGAVAQPALAEPKLLVIQKSADYQLMKPALVQPEKERAPKGKAKEVVIAREATISPAALAALKPAPVEPEIYETAIEAPYRVILSPNFYAGWAHARTPIDHNGRTELWHTRLGIRAQDGTIDETSEYYRSVRAIWSPDFTPKSPPSESDLSPFLMSLKRWNRFNLVGLSSDFTLRDYTPQTIAVRRLMLSALGAWLNVRGAFREPLPSPYNLLEWVHIATQARDQYVKVVEKGYLFPFGHSAAKITITERKFQRNPAGVIGAYLRQRVFIVVRQPVKNYPVFGQPKEGRKIPFRTVQVLTLTTPDLDQPLDSPGYGIIGQSAFWPRVSNADFQFHIVGSDWEGQRVEFTVPLAFVSTGSDVAYDPSQLQAVQNNYANGPEARRKRPTQGNRVAFAPSTKPGDTTFETATMTFGAQFPDNPIGFDAFRKEDVPAFYPTVEEAQVRIGTVEQLTGVASSTRIRLHDAYVGQGLDSPANKGQVFAELLDKVQLAFGGGGATSDKAGGFIAPNMVIGGLSRLLGPVGGDVASALAGKFDPEKFFQDALSEAKFLGDISLKDILALIDDFSGIAEKVPKFVTNRLPDAVETTFNWKARVKNFPATQSIFVVQDPEDTLSVAARLLTRLDGKPPSYDITASLKNFEIHLVPSILEVVALHFKELAFTAKDGKKPDVNADLAKVEFRGPLAFIDGLRQYIPLDGFKDPPNLDVTPEGIQLGYSVGLPTLAIGVMSIQNITLAAGLGLPFTGKPVNFRFNFCEREHPFLLTVSIFGGGGFFAMDLGPRGFNRLEGSLEFGGNVALNLGVASGGVYVMAGVYFAVTGDQTQLTGYLRCGGSLEVLGIITVSVEFNMSLSYRDNPTRVWGRATLTIEIEILFFSTSVDLTVEREFAGGGAVAGLAMAGDVPAVLPPLPVSFADTMDAADWQVYCEAFA